MWLFRPIPHAKYTRKLNPYIPSGFHYSDLYGIPVWMHQSWVSITLFASCAKVVITWILNHVQLQRATGDIVSLIQYLWICVGVSFNIFHMIGCFISWKSMAQLWFVTWVHNWVYYKNWNCCIQDIFHKYIGLNQVLGRLWILKKLSKRQHKYRAHGKKIEGRVKIFCEHIEKCFYLFWYDRCWKQ